MAMSARAVFVCLLMLAGVSHPEDEEPPLVDRPVDLPFSGASAGFVVKPGGELRAPFFLEASAAPVEVEPLAPVTFTVTVHAVGSVRRPPARIDLREVPAFARSFGVEDLTDRQKEKITPSTWRWVYRLRPLREGVNEVPGLPFVFYNPDIRPSARAFQTIYTDPIALHVRPAESNTPPVDVPESSLEFASGAEVLARWGPPTGPNRWLAGVVLLGLPLLCAVWYRVWQRMYPDAARLAHQRRSRAARLALRQLDAAERRRGRELAEGVARALAGYLRQRFDLASAEPTPAEAETLLVRQGCAAEEAGRAAALLGQCAAARFQAEEQTLAELVGQTRQFVLAMEERQCGE